MSRKSWLFVILGSFFVPTVYVSASTVPEATSGAGSPAAAAPAGDKKIKPEKQDKDNDQPLPAARVHNPVLWLQQKDIASLDLFLGQGGDSHQPKPPFTFDAEDMHGTNPKFDVDDADGKKWRVKLGGESRPEVVSSRLLWAMGYFANDDYLLPDAAVENLTLKRGGSLVKDGHVTDARFARKPGGQKKIGVWKWKDNPFTGTREFNGLRVMMAVINNWDLKDVNNAVFYDSKNDRQLFLISDVGATFATNNLTNSRSRDKGNVDEYKKSKFITKSTDGKVDFGTPAPPTGLLFLTFGGAAGDYMKRQGFDWIGRDIPIEDVRWITSLLSQLSHQQIADAFRAANFPAEQADEYVMVVENRIQELKELTRANEQ